MTARRYEKLVGRSLFSVQACYLGDDHLLILEGRFKERAKRIRYRDIEAMLICPTKSGAVLSLVSAMAGFIFLVVALANAGSPALWVGMVFALFCGALFARGVYGKGSALMGIQTAVQTVQLEGVSGMRQARKVGYRLHGRIRSVQGELTAEQIKALKSRSKPGSRPPAGGPPPLANRAAGRPATASDSSV